MSSRPRLFRIDAATFRTPPSPKSFGDGAATPSPPIPYPDVDVSPLTRNRLASSLDSAVSTASLESGIIPRRWSSAVQY